MRIAVLAAGVPFAPDPARRFAAELVSAFERLGHEALLVMLPLPAGPLTVEHVLGLRALRLPNVDRAVAIGFPACAVRHPDKVVWMVGQASGPPAPFARACGLYLGESRAVYADSPEAARGMDAAVLVPCATTWRQVVETLAS